VTSRARRTGQGRLIGWIGWAGLDAIGRLALLTGSTIVFSRLLAPRDFGVTALVLTLVAVAAVFVGSPFEEALAQRRGVRMAHLRAALGASWAIGAVILAASIPLGHALAEHYGEPEFRSLLPVAMASVFFSGHSDIVTALARRLRRFNDVAYATLVGHVVGVGVALAIGLAGYGLWALIAQRLMVVVARAVILQWRIGFLVTPSWAPALVREFGRFAGFSFMARLAENLTYLAFNNLVQIFYGVAALGQVNMAMRLIEPIRGAITATGHNLAFSYFARAGDAARRRARAVSVVSQSAFVTAPVFVGLAAVAPVLLPVVAGPGWDEAVGIAVCLSLASALAAPAGLVYTSFSAGGRPEYSLISLVLGFVAIVVTLASATALGPISVGLSRVAGDLARAGVAVLASPEGLDWSRRSRLAALWPAWTCAAAMGAVVTLWTPALPSPAPLTHLAQMIIVGVVVYGALLALFARPVFDVISGHLGQIGAPLKRRLAR
jgi:O-antigen/teichoic acid export membrane protein